MDLTNEAKHNMQFKQMSSFINPSFWFKLFELKIDVDKLNERERQIWGYDSYRTQRWQVSHVEVNSTSFNADFESEQRFTPFYGKIFNKNTIEQFKDCNKTELINKQGAEFMENITNGTVLQNPAMLNVFFVLSFADLKNYKFYYWFAYPVPSNLPVICQKLPLRNCFDEISILNLRKQFESLDYRQKSYFLIKNCDYSLEIHNLSSILTDLNEDNYNDFYFVFCDYFDTVLHPRTQLKNFIVLLLHHCHFLGGKQVNFIQFGLDAKSGCKFGPILYTTLPDCEQIKDITWVGWEKNEYGQLLPRLSNMRPSMDPKIMFEECADLNLKLMKWRFLPDLDLDKIKRTKCLLIGSGTLGCSVARTLVGWGIRDITFIDNSTVSPSNPVRQILFTYDDSLHRLPKAVAAAQNLRKICPTMNTTGFQFTIPMPGHSVSESTVQSVQKSVAQLKTLINQNDIIFLLTDSRESRWLPTLLCCYYNKTAINVALGFDTYLIMRYGGRDNGKELESPPGFQAISGCNLGCYFCSDVTAPGNSLKDRTLDQQCTVTRPGVSLIAGALSVELAISLMQHEEGINAPAFYKLGSNSDAELDCNYDGMLGLLPHSIRGFLSNFTHVLPATQKYTQCIACSQIILDEYDKRGFDFLLNAFNSSKYLEDLTGLTQLHDENNFIDVIEVEDDSNF